MIPILSILFLHGGHYHQYGVGSSSAL